MKKLKFNCWIETVLWCEHEARETPINPVPEKRRKNALKKKARLIRSLHGNKNIDYV